MSFCTLNARNLRPMYTLINNVAQYLKRFETSNTRRGKNKIKLRKYKTKKKT